MALMPVLPNIDPPDSVDWDLGSFLETLPTAAAWLEPDGTVHRLNNAAEEILGYRSNTVAGAPSLIFIAGEEVPDWTSRLSEVRSNGRGQKFRVRLLRSDASLIAPTVQVTPLKSKSGNVRGLFVTFSEEKPSGPELAPHETRERFEAAIQASGLLLRDWKPEVDEVQCAGNVEGILGVSEALVHGGIERWADWIHSDDREMFMHEFERVLTERCCFDLEYRIQHKNGTYKTVRDRAHLVIDEEGRILRVTALVMDISEQRALEDRLRHSQKMEAFGRLAGGVAHDFNNLLTVISGYSEIMKEEFSASDPRRALIVEVEKAANRAASLTAQLLAFSRQQVLKLQVLNLNDVLADVGKMLRRLIGEHIRLSMLPGEGLGSVRADLGQLEQVLINLAVNARDAMPSGGTLQISTANITLKDSDIGFGSEIPAGDYVILKVADTGMGMPEEIRVHIFEPFFTTKAPGHGTGLGLATCYGIVKQCGGHITVESRVNVGTVFRIYLPRVYEAETQTDGGAGNRKPQGGSEVILLVEDDATVRKLSAAVLARLGYNVVEAEDGEEALQFASARDLRRLDLVITDMVMPRMGGLDLAAQLSVRFPTAKILFTSGYPSQSIDPNAFPNQVAFIQKPFIPKTLAAQVRALLDA